MQGDAHIMHRTDHNMSIRRWTVLNGNVERLQSGVVRTNSSQLVEAGAIEPVFLSIKSGIKVVPRGGTCGRLNDVTPPDTFNHCAFLKVPAVSWMTHNCSLAGITLAVRITVLAIPEFLPKLIVATLIGATTALYGHTLVHAEDEALVALTGFHAGLRAERGCSAVRTAGWAGVTTDLIVAIHGAR